MKRTKDNNHETDKNKKVKSQDREKAIAEVLGYTNTDNPFLDQKLSEQFVWNKKEEKTKDDINLSERKKNEILKLKQERIERELKKQQWEQERERVFRQRESLKFHEYEQKELEFHLKQENLASFIRLKEKRPKVIDFISNNLKYLRFKEELLSTNYDSQFVVGHEHEKIYGIDRRKPFELLQKKSINELQESKENLQIFLECDKEFEEFWKAFKIVLEDEIINEKEKNNSIHQAVVKEIKELLNNKTKEELEEIEFQMNEILKNPDASTDVEYWEGLKQHLKVYKARNILLSYHLRELEVYNEMEKSGKLDRIITEYNDNYKERQSTNTSSSSGMNDNEKENDFFKEIKSREEEGDEDGVEEVKLLNEQQYSWNDKFRPRKPKYFNRVRTGYEWTAYNRTHYDTENPPPKVIQGYRFNIFYPDLIDKTKIPSFHVEKENEDFCILRFHAGPPYEDIAFRIVNRIWERSHRKGYKCIFERGVLQLHFNFKRRR
ncbi:hypothetical protein ABK040_009849 [Willaertia magna]